MAFNIPASFKKQSNDGDGGAGKRMFRRAQQNYADLDDPNNDGASGSSQLPPRNVFSLRKTADGSKVPSRAVTGFPPLKEKSVKIPGRTANIQKLFKPGNNPYSLRRTTAPPKKPEVQITPPKPLIEELIDNDDFPPLSKAQMEMPLFAKTELAPFRGQRMGSPANIKEREGSPFEGRREERKEGGGGGRGARSINPINLSLLNNRSDVLRALRNLHGRYCPTDFDRYQLLDERDKLMCKLREMDSYISNNGTCPDMCPEKERYVRIVQKRLSNYEVDVMGDMEPGRTVKEYSRSAADQEQPLPHEMRPGAVLVRTMEYLLTQIVDNIPSGSEAASWYDFLWNRTRAIRKEITQQMLNNETGVALIESCTRLHMLAAYCLCSLGHAEFDPKMNDENLGKCLQSLRHLYEDLAKKEIFCDSEAEFRAYDVLLHLNDTNILRQVLSYRRVVRESKEIRLVLKLFTAMQSNNYVRFFRLLKEQATFLQCAIVHRYFEKCRLNAWQVLCRAYQRGALYPIHLVTNHFGFDSDEKTLEAASRLGLKLADGESSMLQLERDHMNYEPPETLYRESWIDQKKDGISFSTLLRGSATPRQVPPARPPIHSFDSNDNYTRDPVLAECLGKDSIGGLDKGPISYTTTPPKPQSTFGFGGSKPMFAPKKEEPSTSGGFMFKPFGGFAAVKKEEVDVKPDLAALVAEKREKNRKTVNEMTDGLWEGIVDEMTRSTAQECLIADRMLARKEEAENKQKEEEERQRKEGMRTAQELADSILIQASQEEAKRIAQAEYKSARLNLVNSVSDWLTKKTLHHLNHEWEKEVKRIVENELEGEKTKIETGLERFKERMKMNWIRQFTEQWKEYVIWRKEERKKATRVMEALVTRNDSFPLSISPFRTIQQKKKGVYDHLDVQTALAVVDFEQRRQHSIACVVVDHWKSWTMRRGVARRALRGPLPKRSDDIRMEWKEKILKVPFLDVEDKPRTRRSMGGFGFLAADDSFLFQPATPIRDKNRALGEGTCRDDSVNRRRASTVLNSTALPLQNEVHFGEYLNQQQWDKSGTMDDTWMEGRSFVSESDLSAVREEMVRCGWRSGMGEQSRRRRRKREEQTGNETIWPGKRPKQTEQSWACLAGLDKAEDTVEQRMRREVARPEPLKAINDSMNSLDRSSAREEKSCREDSLSETQKVVKKARSTMETMRETRSQLEETLARYGL